MKTLTGIWLIAYVLAWWSVFWLPARRTRFAPLTFIPAAICAFAIPMLVSDTIMAPPHGFLLFWAITPFAVVTVEVIWRMKKRNPNRQIQLIAGKPGSG